MEELLLSGLHGEYKIAAIRLQLKHGEVEIGPTHKKKKKKKMEKMEMEMEEEKGRSGDAADVVLQVYNAFAHEVRIEYQPAVKQQDTQWRFACDGLVLKTVVPYHFWTTYLFPHEQPEQEDEGEDEGDDEEEDDDADDDADRVPPNPSPSPSPSSSSAAAAGGAFTPDMAEYEAPSAPSSHASDLYSRLGRGSMMQQHQQQHDRRPVPKVLLPIDEFNKPAHHRHSHRRSVAFANSSEAGKKKSELTSAMIEEISEKEIKVRLSRPASTSNRANDVGFAATESIERVIRVKCYRPSALEVTSRELSRGTTPCCSATEECKFLEGKFGLHRDRSEDTGLQPLRQCYGPRELPAPRLESADELMHRRASGQPTTTRADRATTIDAATSPLRSPTKIGAPEFQFGGSEFALAPRAEKGSLFGYGQQYNVLTVGKIMLEEEPGDGARSMWMSSRGDEGLFAVPVERIDRGKISADSLKAFLDFLAKERSMFFRKGRQNLGAERERSEPTTATLSCSCFKPRAVMDVDDMTFAPTGTATATARVRSLLVPRRWRFWTWNQKKGAD
ncbi:hypothetical protein MPTK2_3g03770 [Marchantia polymorpha subsp. ruderalis]